MVGGQPVGSGAQCVMIHVMLSRANLVHSHVGVHFLEASSLTGDNVEAPFLLAARAILLSIESGSLDPEKAGSGVSYGDRALRRVNSSSRLSFGSLSGRPRRATVKLSKVKGWIPGTRCCSG